MTQGEFNKILEEEGITSHRCQDILWEGILTIIQPENLKPVYIRDGARHISSRFPSICRGKE